MLLKLLNKGSNFVVIELDSSIIESDQDPGSFTVKCESLDFGRVLLEFGQHLLQRFDWSKHRVFLCSAVDSSPRDLEHFNAQQFGNIYRAEFVY